MKIMLIANKENPKATRNTAAYSQIKRGKMLDGKHFMRFQ